jgi:hypothetical protein
MHDDGVLHTWFIFNLHTEILFVIAHHTAIYNSHNILVTLSKPLQNRKEPLLTWRASFVLWVPYLVTTAPPLAFAPFTPFPLFSPHYTIYNDDINNRGILCSGQWCILYNIIQILLGNTHHFAGHAAHCLTEGTVCAVFHRNSGGQSVCRGSA